MQISDRALATLVHVAYSLHSIAEELGDPYFSAEFRADALKRANRELGSSYKEADVEECREHLSEVATALESLVPQGFNPEA